MSPFSSPSLHKPESSLGVLLAVPVQSSEKNSDSWNRLIILSLLVSPIPRFVHPILKTLQFLKLYCQEEENNFPRSVSQAVGSTGKEIGEL